MTLLKCTCASALFLYSLVAVKKAETVIAEEAEEGYEYIKPAISTLKDGAVAIGGVVQEAAEETGDWIKNEVWPQLKHDSVFLKEIAICTKEALDILGIDFGEVDKETVKDCVMKTAVAFKVDVSKIDMDEFVDQLIVGAEWTGYGIKIASVAFGGEVLG